MRVSYWAGQKSMFCSSSKHKQSIMIKKTSIAEVFTSKRDDMKNKDMIKETCLPAQSTNEHRKQSLQKWRSHSETEISQAAYPLKYLRAIVCSLRYQLFSTSCISNTSTENNIACCISYSNLVPPYT